MSRNDPSLRVLLFARALRVRDDAGGGVRHVLSAEADLMLFALHRRSAPLLGMSILRGWLEEGGAALYVPLFEQKGCWGFSAEHNSPSLLRAFWRAVLEMVLGVEVAADVPCGGHPLVFRSLDQQFELEVTDEWGDGWNVVVHHAARAPVALERRSRAGTPEMYRGPASWAFV
jgi:hypothetical protein